MPTAQPDPDALSEQAHRLVREAAGDLASLDAAIERYVTVIAITPAGHQHLGIRLNNLGYAYYLRYVRTGLEQDAWQARRITEQGLAVVHPGDHNTSIILSTLVATHMTRYHRLNRPDDLNRVIELGEQALRAPVRTPPAPPTCQTWAVAICCGTTRPGGLRTWTWPPPRPTGSTACCQTRPPPTGPRSRCTTSSASCVPSTRPSRICGRHWYTAVPDVRG